MLAFSDALGTVLGGGGGGGGLHYPQKLAEVLSTVLILPDLFHQPRPSHGLMHAKIVVRPN